MTKDEKHVVWLSTVLLRTVSCVGPDIHLLQVRRLSYLDSDLLLIVVDEEEQSVPLIYPDVCRWLLQVLSERHSAPLSTQNIPPKAPPIQSQ